MVLVGPLARDVAHWVVVADDEDCPTSALDASAPELNGVAPDHLSVVPTDLSGGACIGCIVVVLFLAHPRVHSVGGIVLQATPPEEVLAVGSTRVHELAVVDPLIGIVLSIGRHGGVPRHGTHPYL